MNKGMIRYILGWVLIFEAIFLTLPIVVGIIYHEKQIYSFLIVCICSALLGVLLRWKKPKSYVFYAKEGFVTVSLSWLLISAVGALPFTLCHDIPSYINALFETISGFTTTGASILTDVEALSKTSLFWRSFTHWIGGMGFLVFILAILPLAGGHSMHLMRAESPGPTVGKLVPRMRTSAKILYGIYFAMTILEIILLVIGNMPLFDAITVSFGTAGTGGFAIKADSIAGYANHLQTIVTIFMILFGVNFNVYYLLLYKKPKAAIKCQELRYYLIIIFSSIAMITVNIRHSFSSLYSAFHHAAFQVASIITTTGFATKDFNQWPSFSKTILVTIMFIGACAGSTGGGIKVSRIVILLKSLKKEIYRVIHPRYVKTIRFEDKPVESSVLSTINAFFFVYFCIVALSILIISIDGFSFETNFTAVAATINNIGPGLDMVGPVGNFDSFSVLSKFVLMFDMLVGRLEVFPFLVLFSISTYKHS